MRVTQKMVINDLVRNLSKINNKISTIEQQASSGKRVNKPSDDPSAYYKSLNLKSSKSSIEQFEKNLSFGQDWLNTADSALGSAFDILVRAKEVALANSNDTISSNERKNAANEVSALFDQMIQVGNTKLGTSSIFSGTEILTDSFADDGTYNGNDNAIQIELDRGKRLTINVSGNEVFKGTSGGEDVFDILNDLKTALNNNDKETIYGQLDRIDTAMDQISNYRATAGANVNQIETTMDWFEGAKTRLDILLSENQDSDMIEVITDLAREQSSLQATLSTASKIINMSLVDFLK